jgi:GntR family transcriptional regulator
VKAKPAKDTTMSLDPTDPRSPSKQIADDLRERIVSGELGEGARLPSERELTDRYLVAPQTVRQAVAILKNEGLAIGKPGRGVFVRARGPLIRLGTDRFSRSRRAAGKSAQQAEAEAMGRSFHQEVLELGVVCAPAHVAERLGMRPGEPVFKRYRREYVGDEPNQVAASFYPCEVVEGTAVTETSTGPGGSYARLEEAGYPLTDFYEEFSARMPSPEEVRLLRLPAGTPVVHVLRIAYSGERAVEVFESVVNASMVVFTNRFTAPE